jgi:hypothetical protein
MDPVDVERLDKMIKHVREVDTAEALRMFLDARRPPTDVDELAGCCAFEHGGILVFPDSVPYMCEWLARRGFRVDTVMPSVVVRDRLCRRYRFTADAAPVTIVHGIDTTPGGLGRQLEVFVLLQPFRAALPADLPARERREENETHLGLRVHDPDADRLRELRKLILDRCAMRPDGGGHNPDEGADAGGRSVLYFAAPDRAARGAWVHRIELFCAGVHRAILDTHLAHPDSADLETHTHPRRMGPERHGRSDQPHQQVARLRQKRFVAGRRDSPGAPARDGRLKGPFTLSLMEASVPCDDDGGDRQGP